VPKQSELGALREALEETISLLRGEKKFPEDLTIWGPGGKNVVRIEKVIEKCENALRLLP
jgi:hypothetical protein